MVSNCLEMLLPDMVQKMKKVPFSVHNNQNKIMLFCFQVPESYKLLGMYVSGYINVRPVGQYHRNWNDWYEGFSTVFAFGKYLNFPEINMMMNIQPGDIGIFKND